jgi:hypothetical protein
MTASTAVARSRRICFRELTCETTVPFSVEDLMGSTMGTRDQYERSLANKNPVIQKTELVHAQDRCADESLLRGAALERRFLLDLQPSAFELDIAALFEVLEDLIDGGARPSDHPCQRLLTQLEIDDDVIVCMRWVTSSQTRAVAVGSDSSSGSVDAAVWVANLAPNAE